MAHPRPVADIGDRAGIGRVLYLRSAMSELTHIPGDRATSSGPSEPETGSNRDAGAFSGRDLACLRGGRLVFAGVSFALSAGHALWVTGPNGAGKSSLLRIMAGLARPAAGDLDWQDGAFGDDPARHHARTAFIGHGSPVRGDLTVAESLSFFARMAGLDASAATISSALDRFALSHLADTRCRLLSAGQKRRTVLARLALETRPLWLLDEPTVALDAASVSLLEGVLSDHLRRGGILVITSHAPLVLPRDRLQTLDLDLYTDPEQAAELLADLMGVSLARHDPPTPERRTAGEPDDR